MGEVYRARDTRLDRTVAIKVLPSHVAADPDARQRFDREARAISSLNHPHICTLYDVGHQDSLAFLVMEYVDGETLDARLAKSLLPLDQTLRYAVEIADALDKAHRHGIVHRDLKPGNIMLTKSGVKLLDFGLAKLGGDRRPVIDGLTRSASLTGQGVILGTLQYMAPEQLEAKDADARTDIFAFGAVLYEMVTGRKAFEGNSQASVIAAVLTQQLVSIVSTQPLTPPALDRLVTKCLAKDPDARWQTASDLHDELKWIAEAPAQTERLESASRGRMALARLPLIAGALLIGALAGAFGVWRSTSTPAALPVARLLVGVAPADRLLGATPDERRFNPVRLSRTAMALSPDGRQVVFSAIRGDRQQLYVRALDRLEAVPLAGTEDSENPFFSPDGEWVGFWKGGELKKVPIGGGPAIRISQSVGTYGASWGPNNLVVFAREATGEGLWQVSGEGGTPRPLTTLDASRGERSHRLPHLLPDGKAVLFTILTNGGPAQIAVRSLVSDERRVLIEEGADARYMPTGHLVYARNGTLMAVPFDLARLQVTGGSVGVLDGVMQAINAPSVLINTRAAQFTVSDSGTLLYVPGGIFPAAERSLVWVSRTGAIQSLPIEPKSYLGPRLSPDGQRVAMFTEGQDGGIWIYDLVRGTLTRFATGPRGQRPVWTPDGRRLIFSGPRNLFWKLSDGTGPEERLTTSESAQYAESWSADGKTLAFFQGPRPSEGDIWVLSFSGSDTTARPFVNTAASEMWPDFSPDGRWIAYTSHESGRDEVFVQPYPGPGPRTPVSVGGGNQPVWARNGRELFYTLPNSTVTPGLNKMMVVDVTTTPTFKAGIPRPLQSVARLTVPLRGYDVSSDGQRFITVRDVERPPEPPAAQMIVVRNWFEELKRLVPAK